MVSNLIQSFIEELTALMEGWRFVKRSREFRQIEGDVCKYLHISCINHTDDFDAVGDVAVEFLKGKERVCIVGAELGNIAGTGQRRFAVSSAEEAHRSAKAMFDFFEKIGVPFIERFSDPKIVLDTLRKGSDEARLISPIISEHAKEIRLLDDYVMTRSGSSA